MAAKKVTRKKTTKKSAGPTARKKKSPVKKPAKKTATKKAVTRKAQPKKTAAVNAKKSPAVAKSSTRGSSKSVDGILKSFEKLRSDQQSKLTSVRKKIGQLEAKTKAFQEEIVSLKQQEELAAQTIDTLDTDRDDAVRELLQKIGVKLAVEPAPSPNKSAPTTAKGKKAKKAKSKKATSKASSKKKKKAKSAKQKKAASPKEQPPKIESTPLFDSVDHTDTANNAAPSTNLTHDVADKAADKTIDNGDNQAADKTAENAADKT